LSWPQPAQRDEAPGWRDPDPGGGSTGAPFGTDKEHSKETIMAMNPSGQPRSPYSGKPIQGELDPFDLYASDGDKVGTVVEVNDEFLVVEHGGFLGLGESHGTIPRSYVRSSSAEAWHLSIDSDRARQILDEESSSSPAQEPASREQVEPTIGAAGRAAERPDSESGATMEAHEEELQANKTSRQTGEVVARKEVVEDIETVEVPVTREEVHVERRPISGAGASPSAGTTFGEDEVRIPVSEEQVQVQKVSRPVEEVRLTKEQTQDTEQVTDTVRKERIEVEEGVPTERDSDRAW
jgi:uncharacterized protein (TIGR02271 family)